MYCSLTFWCHKEDGHIGFCQAIPTRLPVDPRIEPLAVIQQELERVCSLVIEQMSKGLRSIYPPGFRFRIYCIFERTDFGEQFVLHISNGNTMTPNTPTLLESSLLLDIADRTRLLADLWKLVTM